VFRISQAGNNDMTDVETVEEVAPTSSASKPGRYHVDEISRDPLPSGHTSRRWGIGIKRDDGSIVIEPDPWEGSVAAVPHKK
jgi:hypothetical protein